MYGSQPDHVGDILLSHRERNAVVLFAHVTGAILGRDPEQQARNPFLGRPLPEICQQLICGFAVRKAAACKTFKHPRFGD
jgi:hypothetical protein